jgi:antitoxin CptB
MDDKRKRILYQATHRGMKETDRIVGGFVTDNVAKLSDLQLDHLDHLLRQPDADILNWLYDRSELPDSIDAEIFISIKDFNRNL